MPIRKRRFLSVLVAIGLPASGAAAGDGAPELYFVTESFPPFTDEAVKGWASGPFAEIVAMVCVAVGLQCRSEVFPWRRALGMAERGEADGIYTVVRIPEREQYFYLSDMVVEGAYGLFVPASNPLNYRQPGDLEGMTIGVYGPSATASVLQELLRLTPTARAELEINNTVVLKKLALGRYGPPERSAALVNRDVAQHLIASEHIVGLRHAGDLRPVRYGIGFSRKRVAQGTFDRFNAELRLALKDGRVKAILDRYGLKQAS